MDTSSQKIANVNGTGDVKKFVTKCDLHCTLKAYVDEKKAVFVAERLDGAAFDIYMGMAEEDKKDHEKLKKALLDNFDRAARNREVAMEELKHKERLPAEGAEVFAYRVLELVKYAYPKFDSATVSSLAKDYFVKGLHKDLQRELKKDTNFENKSLQQLAEGVTYLEIAGVSSKATEK